MMNYRRIITATLCLALATATGAAERRSEHTFRLKDGEERPRATLADAAWLAGSWIGTGFGSRIEEVWNAPSAGSMVGMFKLFDDDGVAFYELMLITVEDGSLSLKVRHFSADFTAWEDKDEYLTFRLVRVDDDALHFGGLSFYRREDGGMVAYILMNEGGELVEHELVYERAPSGSAVP